MRYTFDSVIGTRPAASGRFRSSLRGIAVDASDRLIAVGDRAVKVFDAGGRLLRSWPTSSPGVSVAVARDGRVFVGQAGRIEIFSGEGKRLGAWTDKARLGLVTAIGFHEDAVFAANARAPGIGRYDQNGRYVLPIGDPRGRRGFVVPGGYLDFVVDGDGVLHAANPGKHRVERYSPTGELLGRFGQFGMHDPEHFRGCCNPINLALTRSGHLITTEKAPPRVKIYDPNRELESVIDHEFDPSCRYMDLAVDGSGRLYVADSVRLEISVFTEISPEDAERPRSAEGAKNGR